MLEASIPAAQYLRMSTDHQQYSIDNQASVIADYARKHGFHILQTYADSGISGVILKHRAGLLRLLQDVAGWRPGRGDPRLGSEPMGQDSDEAAHYEYLCKAAGMPVHYCAEHLALSS